MDYLVLIGNEEAEILIGSKQDKEIEKAFKDFFTNADQQKIRDIEESEDFDSNNSDELQWLYDTFAMQNEVGKNGKYQLKRISLNKEEGHDPFEEYIGQSIGIEDYRSWLGIS